MHAACTDRGGNQLKNMHCTMLKEVLKLNNAFYITVCIIYQNGGYDATAN
jgi:hypothetical protein